EEIPIDISKDSEDRFRTWHFPRHNFTLMVFWSQFLVTGTERVINGSNSGIFDLQLDTIDHRWTHKLPGLDFAILSSGHWFFRKLYLFRGTNVAGCVYCNDRDITNLGLSFALRMSFRAALEQINQCQECRRLVTLVRTFSPTHFENGTWDTGGSCQRTGPSDEDEIFQVGGLELELRRIQMEEMERARKRGKKGGKWFEALDITMAMLVRGDGHPGSHWGNKWMKGYNDCTHWCLPGPIDVWNDLLMAMLRKKALLFG
ncbi:Xyloglucan O-acetyltransferase 4, partial [Sarracenia purpurea var. burkii]